MNLSSLIKAAIVSAVLWRTLTRPHQHRVPAAPEQSPTTTNTQRRPPGDGATRSHTHQAVAEQERSDRQAEYRRDRIRLRIEGLALAVLFAATWAAVATLHRLDDSIQLTKRQMQQTEAFTRMQMDQADLFAQQSAGRDANAEAAREQERTNATAIYQRENMAVVILESIALEPFEAGKPIRVTLRFKNIGKTEARAYRQNGEFDWFAITPNFVADYKGFPPVVGARRTGVQSNMQSVLPLVGKRAITESEAASLNDGKAIRVFVWGRIRYDDIFGGSHDLHFCKIHSPISKAWGVCANSEM
jgi:hypothetical protein